VKQVPVVLLGLMQINWQEFIEITRETLGYSPTRGLDACVSPTHRDPAAYVACLDLRNKPLEALRTGRVRGLFRHYFMTFMFTIGELTVRNITDQTNLALHTIESGRNELLVTASGTLEQWHDGILAGCREENLWEYRALMNNIYTTMLVAGFREAFPYRKIMYHDGTFGF